MFAVDYVYFISEDQIERDMVQGLEHLHGFDVVDCDTETTENLNDGSGGATKQLCIEFHSTNFKSSRISYGRLGVRLALLPEEEQARNRDAER